MTHASLFSGIGGFDLAAEWTGWNNVFHCEISQFCQRILKYYWPNAKTYTDIKTTDFTVWRGRIDILTGGFPCQPYSSAGKRLGENDERHLWPEMFRAIREIKPRWVVGENVSGLLTWDGGLVFNEVRADLENEGYEVGAFIIPACAKGAPHQRNRVWIVAYLQSTGSRIFKVGRKPTPSEFGVHGIPWTITNPNTEQRESAIGRLWRKLEGSGFETFTHANRIRHEIWSKRRETHSSKVETRMDGSIERLGGTWNASNTCNQGLQRSKFHRAFGKRVGTPESFRSTPEFHKIENWLNFPTQSPICGRDDGLPTELDGITFSKWRNESIKGYGNAVVPQVVYEIFKAIQNIETT